MKKRILIVDDDPLLNKINEQVLRQSGLVSELCVVSNGQEALAYLTRQIANNGSLPNLIITDLHMPVMNGFEFIDAFNNLEFTGKQDVDLVVFTDSSNPKDRQRALMKGIRNYIEKPYLLRGLNGILAERNKFSKA